MVGAVVAAPARDRKDHSTNMAPRHVLVTGATGFVGASLVLELLRTTDDRVTCLVRASTDRDPLDRLRANLGAAMEGYGLGDLAPEVIDRVGVVVGDLTDPALADLAGELGRVDTIWHSAASLKYQDRDEVEIRATNVSGTADVVALAQAAGAEDFNYISTAYVAGDRSGRIYERRVPDGTGHNNQYERSKIDAERLVDESGLHHRIFRPSIVIGHSDTFVADSSMGVFGFLKEMSRFVRAFDAADMPPITICAGSETSLNFIPVDLVTSSAVEIAEKNSTDHYFHLTNGHEAPVVDGITVACELIGLPTPTFTDDPSTLSAIDKRLNRYLDFYLPYIAGERVFDRTATDSVVGDRCDFSLEHDVLVRIVETWMESNAQLAN
jgi:thioester reductase-like protein